jgi:hypothetical protein
MSTQVAAAPAPVDPATSDLPRVVPGPWADRWTAPPPDIAIATSPADARRRSSRELGRHLTRELEHGRSLYCIVHDRYVQDRIGGFDGRALTACCRPEATA